MGVFASKSDHRGQSSSRCMMDDCVKTQSKRRSHVMPKYPSPFPIKSQDSQRLLHLSKNHQLSSSCFLNDESSSVQTASTQGSLDIFTRKRALDYSRQEIKLNKGKSSNLLGRAWQRLHTKPYSITKSTNNQNIPSVLVVKNVDLDSTMSQNSHTRSYSVPVKCPAPRSERSQYINQEISRSLEEEEFANLQRLYDRRTWEMYFRIKEARHRNFNPSCTSKIHSKTNLPPTKSFHQSESCNAVLSTTHDNQLDIFSSFETERTDVALHDLIFGDLE